MNIASILEQQARARPGSVAIWDTVGGQERTTTFTSLDQQCSRAAALLRHMGLRRGDSVLILQPMSLELYVALIACFRLGLIAMFVDPSAGRPHLERCCLLQPPAAFIGSWKAHLLRIVSPALRRIPNQLVVGSWFPGATRWSHLGRMPADRSIEPVADTDPALLTFTSGSTGQPKAALRSHAFLCAQHRVLTRTLGIAADAVDLATLPVFVLANLGSGATTVIPNADLRFPGRIAPSPVFAQIGKHRVESLAASPALLERLVEYCESTGQQIATPRRIFAGGAPVFPGLLTRLRTVCPQARIVAVYGSTEAEPIAEIAYHDITARDHEQMLAGAGLLAGHAVEEIQLRILPECWGQPLGPFTSDQFEALDLPPDAVGEIAVTGDHVLKGYLHGTGDEETKIRVGEEVWHRTGDLGRLDAENRLWLLGRAAARIADSRGVAFPFAVECVASTAPGVLRSALVSTGGKRILAVQWAPGAIPRNKELEELVGRLGVDQVREIRIPVDPRHNAKVDYRRLRHLL